jgi:uncharacterized protein YjeT (DUF2065 family)
MTDAQIFQLFGILFVALGIAFMTQPHYFKKVMEGFSQNLGLSFITGFFTVAFGYILILFHNTWHSDLSVVVTLLGWASFIKGLIILLFPQWLGFLTKTLFKKEGALRCYAVLIFLFGLIVSYLGFVVV